MGFLESTLVILNYKLGSATYYSYAYENHEHSTLNPCFRKQTFFYLRISSVLKKKERGKESYCNTTTSYKLSYIPYQLTKARLPSLGKVGKVERSKWVLL